MRKYEEKTDSYTMLFVKYVRVFYEVKEMPDEIMQLIKQAEEI